LKFVFTFERGNGDFSAQGGLRKRNRNGAIKLFAFTLEEGMRFNVQDHVEIAVGTATYAGIAHFLIADLGAVFNARRHIDVDSPLTHHAGLAFALGAWISDSASGPMTCGTGTRNAEEALLITDLAASSAGGTGYRPFAGRRPGSSALLAYFVAAELDLGLLSKGSLFEGEGQVNLLVAAAQCAAPLASAATGVPPKKIAEDVAK